MAQPKIQKGTTATGAQASSVHLDEPPRTMTGNRLRAGRGCEVAANPHAFASGPIIRWMGRGRMTSPARR